MPCPTRCAADSVQPRECKKVTSSTADELTRPKKRRRRLQLLAAHKAVAELRKEAVELPLNNTEEIHGHNFEVRFGVIEMLVLQIHWHLIGQWQCNAVLGESHEERPGRSQPTGLDASAPAFVPGGDQQFQAILQHVGTSEPSGDVKLQTKPGQSAPIMHGAAVVIQRIFRGHRVRMTLRCGKCCAKSGDCFCEDILCTQCMMSADDCGCPKPKFKSMQCAMCCTPVRYPSLHDDKFITLPLSNACCSECGQEATVQGNWNFLTASEHACFHCRRRDCQRTIQSCDGVDCDNLSHAGCMKEVVANQFVCVACQLAGNPLDQSASNGSDASATSQDGECQIWEEVELKVWMQVTTKLANRAALACNDHGQPVSECWAARQRIIQRRWEADHQHIPEHIRDALWEMLSEVPDSISALK